MIETSFFTIPISEFLCVTSVSVIQLLSILLNYYHKIYNYVEISVDDIEITDSSLTTYSYMNIVRHGPSVRGVYSGIDVEASSFKSDNTTIMSEIVEPSDYYDSYFYPDFDIVIEGDDAIFDVSDSFIGLEDWTDNYGQSHIYVKETNYTLNISDSEFRTHTYACSHLANLGCNSTYYNCLLYTSPSPRDRTRSRMPSSA